MTSELDGQTPLTADDLSGLIPTWVATRGERWRVENLLTVDALTSLHRRMFADVALTATSGTKTCSRSPGPEITGLG